MPDWSKDPHRDARWKEQKISRAAREEKREVNRSLLDFLALPEADAASVVVSPLSSGPASSLPACASASASAPPKATAIAPTARHLLLLRYVRVLCCSGPADFRSKRSGEGWTGNELTRLLLVEYGVEHRSAALFSVIAGMPEGTQEESEAKWRSKMALQVASDLSDEVSEEVRAEVDRSFRARSARCHPDRGGRMAKEKAKAAGGEEEGEEEEEAEGGFQLLGEARACLRQRESRRRYIDEVGLGGLRLI